MMMEELWSEFRGQSGLELASTLFLVIYVILAAGQNIWAWPVSLVGVTLYAIFCFQIGFYSEVPLQVYYFAISIYAFYNWKKSPVQNGRAAKERPVTGTTFREIIIWLGMGSVLTGIVYWILFNYTDTGI